MYLIDTHSHIYGNQFTGDRAEMLERARKAGLERILLPAIDSETHGAMLALEDADPGFCLSMMGLHPCSAKDDVEKELAIIAGHLATRKFIGIGETGLDFYWDTAHIDQQYRAFRQQAEWAIEYGLPLVIHSRNATDECIDVVSEYRGRGLEGVFHCFSGTVEQARKVIELGFYLGIGGVLTFKNGGLDKVVSEIDMDWLVLETDAPYLAPVPFRGKRNEPSYIAYVAAKLAEIKQMDIQEVGEKTSENARKLFKLN